ncbi:hypothetical protein [Nocardioides sp. GXQ0305]|uniref:hypothetical protein n=1 Tax=Nocardioides sp. GXQ0305 TaxID=3423912 RepID=UPI003D7E393D
MRLAVVCLFVALLTACSGGSSDEPAEGSSGTTAAYDEAEVRAGLAAAFAGSDPTPRETAAGECFAEELLASATPEQLQEGGLVADDGGAVQELPTLPEELAGLAADATLACIDVVEASTQAVTSVRKGDLDPRAYADCLLEAVPPKAQRDALVATMAGRYDDPAVTRLGNAQADCAAEQD